MAKFHCDFDANIDDIIILDDVEVRRNFNNAAASLFRMPETKIDLGGRISFVDVYGNVYDPSYDDQKGEKEDWEAGLLE